jgi:hypothetical protein
MDSQIEQLYQEYLNEKLALIFEKKSYSQKTINTHREIRNKKGYRLVEKFGSNNKYYIVDSEGKKVSKKEIILDSPKIEEFKDGLARIYYKRGWGIDSYYSYNFIDIEGNLLSSGGFVYAGDFHDGYAHVSNGSFHYFIDKNGDILEDLRFENAWDFHEGLARVQYPDYTYNFIDTKGNKLCKKNLKYAGDFHEGLATVEKGGYVTFIDKNGNFIPYAGYDYISARDFHDGCAVVKMGHKYNYVDDSGIPISDTKFLECNDFSNGLGLVKTEEGYNYINQKGKLICKEPFNDAESFKYGLAIVERNHQKGIVNTKGEMVLDEWLNDKSKIEIISNNAYKLNGKVYNINTFLRDNNVKTTRRGYTFKKNDKEFEVKFEPLMVYGTRYVLCINKSGKNIVLYDEESKKYKDIGSIEVIEYDENFIIDHRNNTVSLFYRNQKLDATDYYYEHLKDKKEIYVTEGVALLSREEFLEKGEFSKRDKEKKERKKKSESDQQQREIETKLALLEHQKRIREKERKNSIENALAIIQEKFEELERIYEEEGTIERVRIGNAIKDVGDHREIMPIIVKLGWLKFVDFNGESFINVKMSGIDFSNCNLNGIIPTRVYNKDLSNCIFENVHFDPMASFIGVNICNTKFSDSGVKSMGLMPNFSGAIYNDNSTYNGMKIKDIIAKQNNDFNREGSHR